MGTRSLTHIKDGGKNDKTLVTFYRQFDGYISGHGKEMAEFLAGGELVNGIDLGEHKAIQFNGMGAMAFLLMTHLKLEQTRQRNEVNKSIGVKDQNVIDPGGFYIEPPDASDCGEQYVYTIYLSGALPDEERRLMIEVKAGYRRQWKVIFDGPAGELVNFKESEEES
jgi:hypothetical protein